MTRHDVAFDEIMRVSYNNKPANGSRDASFSMNEQVKLFRRQLVNDSNLSMKFGDCSAVAGVLLTDKSLSDEA